MQFSDYCTLGDVIVMSYFFCLLIVGDVSRGFLRVVEGFWTKNMDLTRYSVRQSIVTGHNVFKFSLLGVQDKQNRNF